MFKKAIISVAGLVIFSAIIIAAFAMTNNNETNNQNIQGMITSDTALNTVPQSVGYKSTNYHTVVNVKYKILTPQEVQKIAEKYIKEPDATAGIPKLVKQDGKRYMLYRLWTTSKMWVK